MVHRQLKLYVPIEDGEGDIQFHSLLDEVEWELSK
jgi:hypothetical protein